MEQFRGFIVLEGALHSRGFDAAQELLAVAPYYWSLDDTTREDGSAADNEAKRSSTA